MYEQYLKHCWRYEYPVNFMEPTLQKYAPSAVFPAYTAPVNNPMYTPSTVFPAYTAPVNNPMYTPSAVSPVYTAPVNNPMYTPSAVSPTYTAPVNNPMHAPSAVSPVYTAPVNNPMYATSAKKETDTQLLPSMTSQKDVYVMDFFFKDKSFNFETLRAAGFAVDNGADLNEVFLTVAAIPEGDEEAWMREWKSTADRIYERGKYSFEHGDKISAREAFLRASAYYRNAEFYRRKDPQNDPHVLELFSLSREAFVKAGKLLDGPFEEIAIPYGKDKLPGYLLLVDDSGKPRPTLIYTNGFDSTTEEGYYVIGAAALRRGFNVILYDGPGTGRMIREKKVSYRPDWEVVLGPVMDYAETRPEIDKSKIVLFGYSLGGYLCARTAAFDHRPAAIVLDDGMTSFGATYPPLPEFLVEWIKAGRDEQAIPVIKKHDTYARWALQNGVWVFGTSNEPEYIRKSEQFALTTEDMRKIKSPALILEGENDLVFKGQASKLASELKAPHKHVVMRNADGAGEHCHMGAMRLLHQTIFDWLHTTLRIVS